MTRCLTPIHCRAPTLIACPAPPTQPQVRLRRPDGNFELAHIDELIDAMLRKDYMFNIALPRLPSRSMLERVGQLEPRVSVLDEEFDEAALEVGGWGAGRLLGRRVHKC